MICHIFAHTFHLPYGNWHTLVKRLSNEAAAQLHPLILFSQEAIDTKRPQLDTVNLSNAEAFLKGLVKSESCT
jgi:hypothetical protein